MGHIHSLPAIVEAFVEPGATPPNGSPPWNMAARGVWQSDARGDPWSGLALPTATSFAPPQNHDAARRQLHLQIRRVFLLVDQYLLLCRLDTTRHSLGELVQETLLRATECFEGARLLYADGVPMNADHARCLRDLEMFAQALQGLQRPGDLEIAHAMDSVLVHCVLLDAEIADAPSTAVAPGAATA